MSNPTQTYDSLTSENAALVLVDHQVGLMSGVRDYSIAELKHNVVGLAKAANALKLPIVVTTTARDSMWGPTIPELVDALPGMQIIDRSSVNVFDDRPFASPFCLVIRGLEPRIHDQSTSASASPDNLTQAAHQQGWPDQVRP
jgi:nicotinamidase-related amidase